MRKYIVGNWKMNGTSANIAEIEKIANMALRFDHVDSALCVPATLISRSLAVSGSFAIGGQDCHANASGPHTGCISAGMLVDAGASVTIIGHSERRADQHETDADIRAKAIAADDAGLSVILCVGETLDERDSGRALDIVLGQIEESVPDQAGPDWLCIAYEPVWAIGTGRIPEMADVAQMHDAIRNALVARFDAAGHSFRILYGGSMNGDNAATLLEIANVGGGLIGGASLSASKFEPILAAAAALAE
jgi:triosephosphate isomerase